MDQDDLLQVLSVMSDEDRYQLIRDLSTITAILNREAYRRKKLFYKVFNPILDFFRFCWQGMMDRFFNKNNFIGYRIAFIAGNGKAKGEIVTSSTRTMLEFRQIEGMDVEVEKILFEK